MEFFDKIGKKASATYKVTAEKTGKIAKEAKLKMKMNENKSEIEELYKEIGKKVYEKHTREENIDIKTELEEECTKIDVLSAEIESTLKECLKLKDRKQCPNCYTEIEKTAQYCPNCGARQEEDVATVEEEVKEEVAKSDDQENTNNEKQDAIEIDAVSVEYNENEEGKK